MAAAPSRNRCRSKTMPGAPRLHSVLFVLLGLTLATLATGNDAISAPKSPKDLQQQPSPNRQQDIEDDGGARPDKDFDFAAYVNDFNLQEEATIPEDIFDQHDGDIEDEDLGSPQMQYAPSGAAAPSGTNEEVEEDDDDNEEDAGLGLMEHGQEQDEEDEDASEAADIILESQRPTSRNFSVYLDPKKYQNNNGNNKKRAKEKKNNISHYNYKLKNNKENQPATKATKAADGGGVREAGEGGEGVPPVGGTTFTSGDEDNANFGRQSFAYKKFKNMHEQQNQQQQHQEEHQEEHQEQQQHQEEQQEQQGQEQHQLPKEQRKRGDDGQQQLLEESQLFDSIEILNERKFNKPSGGQKQELEQHGARQVDEAIGDIEDNLDNDEVLPTDNDGDDDDGEDDQDGGESVDIKLANDNDGLPNKKNPVAPLATTTGMPRTDTTTTRATPTTTTTTTTVTPKTTTSSSTTRTPTPTIGHKQKRHGSNVFGLKRPIPSESRYYGSNYEIGRIRQQEQVKGEQLQLQDSEEDQDLNLGEMHYYDNGNIKRKLATFDTTRSQDLGENSLSSTVARKLQQPRFVDDDYAEQQPPPEEEEEKVEVESPPDDGKLETDVDSAWQRYHQDTTEPPTSAPESAFERFKALRRSRQRTGHKSHKKRYKDYLKRQPAGTAPPPEPTASARHLQKLQKERERERERSFSSHSPPIFAVGLRPQKPFYEGQVNYFDHHQLEQEQEQQQQLEEDLKHRTEMERLIAHDNGNWYRRISPVLRNGVKTAGETQKHHHQHQHQQQQHHPHHHSGHLGNHHHHQHSHHYSHHRGQHSHHQKATPGSLRSRGSNPYQRKPAQTPSGSPSATSSPPPTPPLPPPKPQLGHQITELQHLERYYAKWPHLARVQFQVYDEHYRESHPELYSDYEDDYESAAELEEAQQERGEEANLPPYIKKYNRRNKQLLNLLEGTLPTPTNAPPPPGGGGSSSTESGIRLDDEYLKEKRRRYHQHQHQRFDLFAQQRSHLNATESSPSPPPPPTAALAGAHHQPTTKEKSSSKDAGYIYVGSGMVIKPLKLNDGVFKDEEYKDEIEEERRAASTTTASNHLPEEDVAASDSVEEHPDPAPASAALDFWQREMANKASATAASTTSTSTPKPALFKLPSYPAIAGSFLGTPRSRSRSAQFVANVAGRGQNSWPRLETTVNATAEKPAGGGGGGENPPGGGGGGGGRGAPSPLNSFVYHRVVDGIGMANGIGGGGGIGSGLAGGSRGKQSRLPFVAITDRRLDRSLGERHKDFEQNHYPMP